MHTHANVHSCTAPQTNGVANGFKAAPVEEENDEESIYHLPASLQDLVDSFDITRKRTLPVNTPSQLRMMQASQANTPDVVDADAPKKYRPDTIYSTVSQYPQEPLPIFDDPRLYSRIDPDTLFYVFYYKQGSYQQYLAAKALKDQSWRFHKQYQTWFQRHEEPKSITEEFEQGTYRFFDYESTWLVLIAHTTSYPLFVPQILQRFLLSNLLVSINHSLPLFCKATHTDSSVQDEP